MRQYVDLDPSFSDYLWSIEPEDLVNAEVTNTPLKQLFANTLFGKKDRERLEAEINRINETLGGQGVFTGSLVDTVLKLQDDLTKAESRITLLELMYSTDVTENPFSVTFPNLSDVNATGVWNQTARRLEF